MLVISIHDVSPQTQAVVEEMLRDLKSYGVDRCSLLVIPNHHGIGWLEAFPEFVTWLHQKRQEGHEIVLHGLYHSRPQGPKENLLTRWITNYYTAGEGEFFDLSYEEAHQKLSEGRTHLEKIGFLKEECVGFIPPAWLLSAAAEKAVHDLGFLYTTRLGGVFDTTREPSRYEPSQSMVYSVRARWRRWVSLRWNEFLFQTITKKKRPLLRISLHPPDWGHATIRAHALRSIQRALSHRVAVTYRDYLLKKSGSFGKCT
ncbi:MAG: polysaccharide deacetylase family protein [Chthoniobacterales bacterium]|nr:polysaccharide deacetylase family protein [Chthoniobacterales bacterium]